MPDSEPIPRREVPQCQKISVLNEPAKGAGASQPEIDEAIDADNQNIAITELILKHEARSCEWKCIKEVFIFKQPDLNADKFSHSTTIKFGEVVETSEGCEMENRKWLKLKDGRGWVVQMNPSTTFFKAEQRRIRAERKLEAGMVAADVAAKAMSEEDRLLCR